MSKYDTNLASEFWVLSTLYRLGVEASLTLGNKKSVDIIIHRPGTFPITIDVKGLAGTYDWPADNIDSIAEGHYYVMLSFEGNIEDPSFVPSAWIIPATRINEFIKSFKTRKDVMRKLVMANGGEFKNNWKVFQQASSTPG
jgi:hypothetical protein